MKLIGSCFKLDSLLLVGLAFILGGINIPYISGEPSPSITGPRTIFEGATLTLTCTATCANKTVCQFKWTGDFTDSGSTLSVTNIPRNPDAPGKKYSVTCTATDPGDSSTGTDSRTIDVFYGPDNVTIAPAHDKLVVHEHNTQGDKIACNATCHPSPCNITWSRENAIVSNGPVLYTYSSIKRAAAGTYTCTAVNNKNATSISEGSLEIEVYYGPDNVTIAPAIAPGKKLIVHENNARRDNITCSATCHPSPCNITWSRGNSIVSSGPVLFTYSSIKRAAAGIYTCKAVNKEIATSLKEGSLEIDVYYGPDKVTISPEPANNKITVPEKDTSNTDVIKCAGTCHPSPCSIKWMKGQTIKTEADAAELTLYTVKVITRQDAGDYQCIVKHRVTDLELTSSVEIIVEYPPDIVKLVWDASSHTLTCEASGVPNIYTFHEWAHTRAGTSIRTLDGNNQGSISTVTFPAPNHQDTGKYTCSVDNGIPNAATGKTIVTKEIYAEEPDIPFLVASNDSYNVSKGDQLSFTIDVYAIPKPRTQDVSMYKIESDGNITLVADTDITPTDHFVDVEFYGTVVKVTGTRIRVVIEAMKEEHFGNHTVVIKNNKGENSTAITLYPEGPPDSPANLSSTEHDHESVTLTLTSGFFNGADQTFIIEYAPSGGSDWKNGTSISAGDHNRKLFSARIQGLVPETEYMFRSYGYNAFDHSDYADDIVNVTTLADPLPLAAIVGGTTGGSLLIILLIVVAVLLCRRSRRKKEKMNKLEAPIPLPDMLSKRGFDNEVISDLREQSANPHTSTNSGGTDSGIDVTTPYENTTFRPAATQSQPARQTSEVIYQNCDGQTAYKPNQNTVDEEDYVNSSQYKVPPSQLRQVNKDGANPYQVSSPHPGLANQGPQEEDYVNSSQYKVPPSNLRQVNKDGAHPGSSNQGPQEDAYLDMNVIKEITAKPKTPVSPRRGRGKFTTSTDTNTNAAEEPYMPMDVMKQISSGKAQRPAIKTKPKGFLKQKNEEESEGEQQYLKMDTLSRQLENKFQQRGYVNTPAQGVNPYMVSAAHPAVNSNQSGQDQLYDVPSRNRESVPDYLAPPPPMPVGQSNPDYQSPPHPVTVNQNNDAGEENYMNLVMSPKPR